MGSYPQDLINIHFLKCICNNINLWKHYLPSICYIFMELSYTRHVYSICCSLLQNFLICIMLDSAVCSLLLVQHHTCVCVVTITTCRLPNFINDQNSNTSCVPLVAVQFILETTGTLHFKIRPIISLSIWLLLMNGVITKRFNFNQIVIYTQLFIVS